MSYPLKNLKLSPVYIDYLMRSPGDTQVGDGKRLLSQTSANDMQDHSHIINAEKISEELSPRYVVHERIGEGSSGWVFRCYDNETQRFVALKVLTNEAFNDEESVTRFEREIEYTRSISHPNVIDIIDSGVTQNGVPFVVMELLEGGNLKEMLLLAPDKQIPFREAVEMLLQISEGIAALHEKGIIHRDIKPGNIIFDEDGTPKVTDLGLARSVNEDFSLTKTGMCLGTPYYMSPEQVRCEPVSLASDIYSLSVLAYEIVMGHRPYEEDNWFELAKSHCADPLPELAVKDAGVPCWFEAFIKKAGAKAPEARYQTAAEFSAVLKLKRIEADAEKNLVAQGIHFIKPNGVLCTYLRNRGISRRRSGMYLLGTIAALTALIILIA